MDISRDRLFRRHPGVWVLIVMSVVGLLTGLAMTQRSQAAEEVTSERGTLPYSHRVHVQEAGIQCLFCHSEALRAPQAGLPSLQKCMVCHAYVTLDNSEAQQRADQVKAAFEQGQRPQWPDVYKQPDYVYFSHRPHLAQGVACETCHGDVQNMDLVEKTVDMNMGFCLDCHRRQSPADQTRLTDCVTCHK